MAVQPVGVAGSQQAQDVQQSVTPKIEQVQKPQFQPLETSEAVKAITEEATQKTIQNLNELLKAKQTNISLDYDNFSTPSRVNVVDANSGKVIKTMPPEAAVEIAEKAKNFVIGLMVDHKA